VGGASGGYTLVGVGAGAQGTWGCGAAGALALLNSQHERAPEAPWPQQPPPCRPPVHRGPWERVWECIGICSPGSRGAGGPGHRGAQDPGWEASAEAPATVPLSALLAAGPLPLERQCGVRGGSHRGGPGEWGAAQRL